jgi:hypothetical protein
MEEQAEADAAVEQASNEQRLRTYRDSSIR